MDIRRYVALGDSFTEGVGDIDARRPNGVRGWADRVAEQLAELSPDLEYANLAVRGKLLPQIISEQVPRALELAPDLVTVYGGGNDLMRPSVDIDALMDRYDAALGELTAAGASVMVFTAYDTGWAPVFGKLRGRLAIYNELLREICDRRDLLLLDYWRLPGYDDYRMWDTDRLHMSPYGHTVMATEVLERLGVAHSLRRPTLPPSPARTAAEQRADDLQWARGFLAPWVMRRIRGVSSGDGITARWPEPTPARELAGGGASEQNPEVLR